MSNSSASVPAGEDWQHRGQRQHSRCQRGGGDQEPGEGVCVFAGVCGCVRACVHVYVGGLQRDRWHFASQPFHSVCPYWSVRIRRKAAIKEIERGEGRKRGEEERGVGRQSDREVGWEIDRGEGLRVSVCAALRRALNDCLIVFQKRPVDQRWCDWFLTLSLRQTDTDSLWPYNQIKSVAFKNWISLISFFKSYVCGLHNKQQHVFIWIIQICETDGGWPLWGDL